MYTGERVHRQACTQVTCAQASMYTGERVHRQACTQVNVRTASVSSVLFIERQRAIKLHSYTLLLCTMAPSCKIEVVCVLDSVTLSCSLADCDCTDIWCVHIHLYVLTGTPYPTILESTVSQGGFRGGGLLSMAFKGSLVPSLIPSFYRLQYEKRGTPGL